MASERGSRVSGIAWAITAGIGFGLFQAVNRRANQGIDAYRATFGLLLVGTIGLVIVSVATQDLGRLADTPVSSYLYFSAAGFIHFFLGWTLLALGQQKDGANRTGATVAAVPLVATLLAALFLDEPLTLAVAGAVVLVVTGMVVLSLRGGTGEGSFSVPWFGIASATTWGTSPLFIRWGLEGLDAPLLGVTVGLAAATLAYAVALTVTGRWSGDPIPMGKALWLALAGVLVAIAISAQWTSYNFIEIATAVTLMQLSAPTVILTAPLIVGFEHERITLPLVLGTGLVMAGSILVILVG